MPRDRSESKLVHVGFKADEETVEAIDALIEAVPDGVVAKKSVVIRKALIEAAKKLRPRASRAG